MSERATVRVVHGTGSQQFMQATDYMQKEIDAFLALEAKAEEWRKYQADLQIALEKLAAVLPLGSYFQGPDGVVYKVTRPSGHFVHYRPVGFDRTKRPGERAGSLSAEEATRAGFTLPKAGK